MPSAEMVRKSSLPIGFELPVLPAKLQPSPTLAVGRVESMDEDARPGELRLTGPRLLFSFGIALAFTSASIWAVIHYWIYAR